MNRAWKILGEGSKNLKEQLLLNRGLKTKKEIEEFFHPDLKKYSNILDIPNIDKAIKRIERAVIDQELIIVYGDYDVDGITASAILYKGLTSIGAKVLPYIPHREKEGYGLSKLGLEFARDSGASVVITVDNGIVAIEQAIFAKELGLDLIITDHHMQGNILPDAFTIVHSTKMCGAAVAWCLVRNRVSKELSGELLELVAVATVADMMPLLGVNRAFLTEGLKVLNRTRNIGFKALIDECGIKDKIGSYEIGHMIGPRLNAIGRLEHAIDGLRLLCTKDEGKAKKLAKLLGDTNLQRQELTVSAVEQARLAVKKDKKIHVLDSRKWSSGIIGLIAGRITEEYQRPSIAIAVGEVFSKGSARSIKGVNIVELIRQCADLLIDVGGHPGAAGFSIENKKIDEFRLRLEELVEQVDFTETELEIEAVIEAKLINKNLVKELDDFEPFGFSNPKPVLATYKMRVSDLRTLSEGKHLKFKADGVDVIAFGMGEMINVLQNGNLVDVAYNLEINKFKGNEYLQLKAKDIRISETT